MPQWFFAESLATEFRYRALACDVGLVQKSAVEEDLPATVEALARFWYQADGSLDAWADELLVAETNLVVCDIAPLGIAIAERARLRSVLVENFTWNWIYEPLVVREPALLSWVEKLGALFESATWRIQAEPVSALRADATRVAPIARAPRSDRESVRRRLGIPEGAAMILVSLGGIPWRFDGIERWRPPDGNEEAVFVVPGADGTERHEGRFRLLPHHSPVHHPDLVAAADVVVGKLGYSTVAEAYRAGAPFLFIPRPGFRETEVLARFVAATLPSAEISLASFRDGEWTAALPPLLAANRPAPHSANGADDAAARIIALFDGQPPVRNSG